MSPEIRLGQPVSSATFEELAHVFPSASVDGWLEDAAAYLLRLKEFRARQRVSVPQPSSDEDGRWRALRTIFAVEAASNRFVTSWRGERLPAARCLGQRCAPS